jgi:hypothetical protein
MRDEDSVVLRRLRAILLGLLGLGLAGAAAELLLVGHYEDPPQVIPLAVIALSLASLGHHVFSRARGVRVFRAVMVALVACGFAGGVLHHRGSREFQLEVDPSLGGLELVLKVLHAKTPPALAPGNLVLFGLLGLASTYKQPTWTPPPAVPDKGA